MKTVKLYDKDSHLYDFKAAVISCESNGDEFEVVLDQTAFFPEGGGQKADTGYINEAEVTDVRISDGVIYHRCTSPVCIGEADCRINKDERFRRMQGHSGEHIFSGIAHKLYGCENVGFHLTDEVTVDFDRELDDAQIRRIETLTNEAIYKNLKITAEYPDAETLKTLEYRSKLELTEDVRIVTIEGIDVCACCAPHVSRTGEIGIIKVTGYMRHRGGIRIVLRCGMNAFEDICTKQQNLAHIAAALCAKQNEAAKVFDKLSSENIELKQNLTKLKNELAKLKAQSTERTEGDLILFEQEADMPTLRKFVLENVKNAGRLCAGFSGNDDNGYVYVVASENIALRSIAKEINSALNGKGGGSDELLQGSVKASEKEIRKFFNEVLK